MALGSVKLSQVLNLEQAGDNLDMHLTSKQARYSAYWLVNCSRRC